MSAPSAPRQCAPTAAVGCSFEVWTKDRHILKIEPTHGPANGISTCVKGKFAWDYINSDDRLVKPLLRDGDSFREIEWDEALDIIEHKFNASRTSMGRMRWRLSRHRSARTKRAS